MKIKLLIINLLFISQTAFSQDEREDIKAISEEACVCLEEIEFSKTKSERYEEIKSCITTSNLAHQLSKTLMLATNSINETISDSIPTEGAESPSDKNIIIYTDQNQREIEEDLLRNCAAMKRLMESNDELGENSLSDKKRAVEYYTKGQVYFENEKFENAIVEFSKAVKKDKNFAFAWDMLGYSYRKLGQYKEAIECYDKSLTLDPKGSMPLMNKPVAYELLQDYENAVEAYNDLILHYPNEAEGYYGLGRMNHLLGDYENALENTMKAYNMYNETGSPYARDAENNLAIIYNELKEKNQLDLFNRMAEMHNLKIQD